MIKNIFLLLCSILTISCCGTSSELSVVVTNDSEIDHSNQMIELDMATIQKKLGADSSQGFIITSVESRQEIPSQVTYDGKLIFPASFGPKSSQEFVVTVGEPMEIAPKVFGAQFPQRVDDFAWENDRIAFRTYGPALQKSGERAFGYDVWTKSVPELVVDYRYELEIGEATKAKLAELSKSGDAKALGAFKGAISYHLDHGNGMDFYNVGPTLGSGTAALMDGEEIIYPYCYSEYEVLDNGPLRLTFKLTYLPTTIGEQENVIESRIISIDAGSQLNKTTVSYANLESEKPIVIGLVMREGDYDALYNIDNELQYATYATSPYVESAAKNGVIYVGAIATEPIIDSGAIYFSLEESKNERSGATGHTALISNYKPESEFVYYWGAGWSKYGFESFEEWNSYMSNYAQKLKNPLKVKL